MRITTTSRSHGIHRYRGLLTTIIVVALGPATTGCTAFSVDAATSTTTTTATTDPQETTPTTVPDTTDTTDPTTTTAPETTTSTSTTPGSPTTTEPIETTTTIPTTTTTLPGGAMIKPDWVGIRPLPIGREGYAINLPTPPILEDRRFVTQDFLPPPIGLEFEFTISPVTPEIASRTTWRPECPVKLDELRYLTMSFWGFDGRPHTGEMVTNSGAAQFVVAVFRQLYIAKFPIEEMRVTSQEELDSPPTGTNNRTESFVCRPAVGNTGSWSRHARGLAVDINPFHNPYYFRGIVYPELAISYTDRSNVRPGMIYPGDVVTQAFEMLGWIWGGTWSSKDWMHFSDSGR